jgi:trimeric autotransporter adhesin
MSPLASFLVPRLHAFACSPFRNTVVLVAAVVCLAGSHSVASAQTVDPNLWVTNGSVGAVVRDGGTIYIGGNFSQVGLAVGGGVPIDATSGVLPPSFPKVAGSVYAIAPDGSGGWYIGGKFTFVGGMPRLNLAHVVADLSVSDWNPSAGGSLFPVPSPPPEVRALAVSGSTVYVGGTFTNSGGKARNNIAALDAVTGAATDWNPNANDVVMALAVGGSTVYAGGLFTSIGNEQRNRIAALDATTGAATAWDPNATSDIIYISALAVSGSTLYVGGNFYSIGGQARNFIAALDAATGSATSWDPNANGMVFAIAMSGSTIYVGGDFQNIGGQDRNFIAALDAATGTATDWNPNADHDLSALAVSGSTVYAGGHFSSIGGQSRSFIAALDATTGAATAWSVSLNNEVSAVAVTGSTVYAGGLFTSTGGQARNNIAALDAATGAPTAWNPNADGAVSTLVVSGSIIYAGGGFGSVGGQTRNNIAALDATTGAATAWNPNADRNLFALAVIGSTVYAGGAFTSIGGQMRSGIAALDAASGDATAWDPSPSNVPSAFPYVSALAVNGSTVYVAGRFLTIAGQPRSNIAALDATTGTATDWNPGADGPATGISVSGSTVYACGNFGRIGGQTRFSIAALDAATGAATDWNPSPNGSVYALAVRGSTIYAGGDFISIGGPRRSNIAALDATTGMATPWDPNANGTVSALAVSGSTVYAGGGFTSIGGLPQSGIASLSADVPTATLLAQFVAATTADGIELRWSFGDPGRVSRVGVERASQTTGPWSTIAPELHDESGVTVALDRTATESGSYLYRLVVQLTSGGSAVFGPVSANILEPLTTSDLTQLAPNPTSGETQVRYAVARAGRVRLELLDVSGRVAATLEDRDHEPGRYVAVWDGMGRRGRVAPGVYYLCLTAPDRVAVRKLAVMR